MLLYANCISSSPLTARHRSRRPTQETLDAEVLIDIFPFDAVSPSTHLPIVLLFRGGMIKTGIPYQWNNNRPTIHQIHT